MKCHECFGTGACGYNIMLPYYVRFPGSTPIPPETKYVTIDKCLLREILDLWEQGVKTTGCCCGHGNGLAYIAVQSGEYASKMLSLGYSNVTLLDNANDAALSFVPKTALHYGDADKGFNWWDENALNRLCTDTEDDRRVMEMRRPYE